MATPGVKQRGRNRGTVGAIFALAVHMAVLGFLVLSAPVLSSGPPDARAISVDLVAPTGPAAARPRSPTSAAPPDRRPTASAPVEQFHRTDEPAARPLAVAPSSHAMAATAPSQAGVPSPPALRNTIIACAFMGVIEMSEDERRHCHDMFAAGAKDGPDLSSFAVAPAKKAAFDAAADRENFLQKPVLSQRPKNGCKPFVGHQQYVTVGQSRDAYTVSFGCGKSF
jgi:hypothetical protein